MLAAHEEVAYRNIEVTPTYAAIGVLVECGEVTTMNAATSVSCDARFSGAVSHRPALVSPP
jgi:hypothetical protein